MSNDPSWLDLSGRVALVTGGATGIGWQIASGLAAAGADVVVCARDGERCADAAERISAAHGVRALGLRCDVRDGAEIDLVVQRTVAEFGRVDVLVNNAGASWGAPVEAYPLEAWEKVIGVNLTGTFLFSQAVGRHLIEQRSGVIVNVSSSAVLAGAAPEVMNAIAYTSSKGGVVAFTRDLAVKWARHGIRVNAVAPGWFPTDMSNEVLRQHEAALLDGIPMGRFGGEADLAGVVIFLASRASAYVTGQVIAVDGGQSL